MCFLLYTLLFVAGSYISSSSEDLGENHSGETVSAVVQCGYSKLQHSVLVLHGTQIQQAADTENRELLVENNKTCLLIQQPFLSTDKKDTYH